MENLCFHYPMIKQVIETLPLPLSEEIIPHIKIPETKFSEECYDSKGRLNDATFNDTCWCGMSERIETVYRVSEDVYTVFIDAKACNNNECIQYILSEQSAYTIRINGDTLNVQGTSHSRYLDENIIVPYSTCITEYAKESPFKYLDVRFYF